MKLTSAAMAPMFVACWFGLAGYPYERRLKLLAGAAAILALGLLGLFEVCVWLNGSNDDSAKELVTTPK